MKYSGSAALALCISAWCATAHAGAIPQVMVSNSNQPPACATPGRLMAFVKSRNPKLRGHFDKVAVHYMSHGEALNIRWDFAFYQMLLETASLRFNGDVNWRQNNFAGLGATGGGVKGERFATVSDGVRAHLEHLLIYAGVRVENPVADRTRKVQSWNILSKWRRTIRGPMTFGHIGQKWAPNDRGYASDIRSIADAFARTHCNRRDPRPDLLAEARGGASRPAATRTARVQNKPAPSSITKRASLGASTVYRRPGAAAANLPAAAATSATAKTVPQTVPTRSATANVQVLNSAPPPAKKSVPAATSTAKAKPPAAQQPKQQKVASAGQLAGKFARPWLNPATRQKQAPQKAEAPKANPTKCRVWTASYGGQKAIIIKSADTSHVNYTVLDVNSGREKQEADAYIAAYAQGGSKIGEYKSQTLALDKAFKLCPDG